MRITDVTAEIAKRCSGLADGDRADAFLDDLRKCGVNDGPALQDAFDKWAVSWKKRAAPMAAEFREFYISPEVSKTVDTASPAGEDWAVKVLTEFHEGERACNANPPYAFTLAGWCKQHPGKIPDAAELEDIEAAAWRTGQLLAGNTVAHPSGIDIALANTFNPVGLKIAGESAVRKEMAVAQWANERRV